VARVGDSASNDAWTTRAASQRRATTISTVIPASWRETWPSKVFTLGVALSAVWTSFLIYWIALLIRWAAHGFN